MPKLMFKENGSMTKKAIELHKVPAIVLGLGPTGLGVVRSLATGGAPVTALFPQHHRSPYSYTRLCKKIPVASQSREDLWNSLLPFGASGVRPILFFTSDLDVVEASARREQLCQSFRFLLPDHHQLQTLMQKTSFAAFATANGLPTPKTFLVENGAGWDRILEEGVFPCIIKPRYHTSSWGKAGFSKTFTAQSRNDLNKVIRTVDGIEQDFVIQEWIPGPDSDVFFYLAYYNQCAEAIVSFTGRKIRQWAPRTGSTSMAEPVENPEVKELAQHLFKLVSFRGIGSVEFKLDRRDGKFKIIEPTVGRANLQSEVATANGVNIAYRAYCDLAEIEPDHTEVTERKVRWVFLERDLRSSLYYLRRRETTLRDIWRSYQGPRYYAEFSWTDPLPAFMRTLEILTGWMKRLFRSPKKNHLAD
jgi:predicted ATP-grasp superfamily ATP-dependent carboligase